MSNFSILQTNFLSAQAPVAAKQDENQNDTKSADEEPGITPAFPNGRRVSMANTQCCNGFQESGVCNII